MSKSGKRVATGTTATTSKRRKRIEQDVQAVQGVPFTPPSSAVTTRSAPELVEVNQAASIVLELSGASQPTADLTSGSLQNYENHRESKDGFHRVPNGHLLADEDSKRDKKKIPNGFSRALTHVIDRKDSEFHKKPNDVSSKYTSAAHFSSIKCNEDPVVVKKLKMEFENAGKALLQLTSRLSNPKLSPLSVAILRKDILNIKTHIPSVPDSEIATIEQQDYEVESLILQEIRNRLESKYKGKSLGVVAGLRTWESVLVVYIDPLNSTIPKEDEQIFCGRTVIFKNPKRIPHSPFASKRSSSLSVEQIEIGRQIINDNARNLWSQHSNLNIITIEAIADEDRRDGMPGGCIVLYCTSKGIIPLDQKTFPSKMTTNETKWTLSVKIKEGFFAMCPSYTTSASTTFHQDLKMGCSISGVQTHTDIQKRLCGGTIGPFIDINGETGFLTCAHVLFDIPSSELLQYLNSTTSPKVDVMQPEAGSFSNPSPPFDIAHASCGRVYKAVFDPKRDVSVDVAAVKITDGNRKPIRGRFAIHKEENYKQSGFDELPEFNSGHHVDTKDMSKNRAVVKCGNTTHFTHGYVKCWGTQVRLTNFTGNVEDQSYEMKNQIEIESSTPDIFFSSGDSGSAVFHINEDSSLECIGMAIGITSNCSAIVTPISAILDVLGVRLKTFQ